MLRTVSERAKIIELADEVFPAGAVAVIHLDDPATKVGPRTFRKRILRYGAWQHDNAPGKVLRVDRSYGERIANNFATKVFDAVKAVKGHPKNDAERIALASGDILAVEATDDGVYMTVAVPQDVATEIEEGKIVGCSAGIVPEYIDHELGGRGNVGPVLDHVAFTNNPYIKGLGGFDPVHLADHSQIVLLSLSTETPEETPMDRTELATKAKELGIDIDALEADAAAKPTLEAELAALKAEVAKAPSPESVKADATEAAKGELVTALSDALGAGGLIELAEGATADLSTVVTAVVNGLAAGKATQEKLLLSEAEHDVDDLVKAGRILPSQRDAMVKVRLSDEDTFKALVPATPIVDLSEHGTTGADGTDEILLADGTAVSAEVDRLYALIEGD